VILGINQNDSDVEESKADKFFQDWLIKSASRIPVTRITNTIKKAGAPARSVEKIKSIIKRAGGSYANAPVNPPPEPIPSSAISYSQDIDKQPPQTSKVDQINLRGSPGKSTPRVDLESLRRKVDAVAKKEKEKLKQAAKEAPGLAPDVVTNFERPESPPENLGRPSEVENPEGWGVIPTIKLPFYSGYFSPRGDASLEKGAENKQEDTPEKRIASRIKKLQKGDEERAIGRKIVRVVGLPFLFRGGASSALRRVVGLGLKSTVKDVGELGKEASITNLFSDVDAHPIALSVGLEKKYGNQWRTWEPETLESTLGYDGFDVRPINFEKVMAARAILCENGSAPFYTEPNVFEKVVLAFNGTHPRFVEVQEVPVNAIAFAVSTIENHLKKGVFGEKVAAYVAARCREHGFLFPPLPLAFCEPYLEEHIDPHLKKKAFENYINVIQKDGKRNKDEEDVASVQVEKHLGISAYLLLQQDRLARQLPDLVEG